MNKLVIDGIDYTDIKKKFYQLSKQTLCNDLIKKIYEYGKLEQALNEIKEVINRDCDFNGTGFYDKWIQGKKSLQILDKVGGNE